MTANRFVRLVFETAVDRVFSEGGEEDCSSCFRSVCSPSLLDDSELMIRRRFWEPAGIASSARRLAPPLLMLATVSDASAKSIFSAPPAASDSFKNSILERRPAFDRVAGMRQYCSCYTTKGLKLIFFILRGKHGQGVGTDLLVGWRGQSHLGNKFQKGVVFHGCIRRLRERDEGDGLVAASIFFFTVVQGFSKALGQPD